MYSRNSPGIKESPLEAAVNTYVRHFQIPGGTISQTGNVMIGGDPYSYIVSGKYNMLFKKLGAIPNRKNCDGGHPISIQWTAATSTQTILIKNG